MTPRNIIKCMCLFVALAVSSVTAPVRAAAQFPRQPEKPKGPWMDKSLSPDQRADLVIGKMTLDEKISLLHGTGFRFGPPGSQPPTRSLGGAGFIPGIYRLGIPDLQLSDAALGVARGNEFGRYSTLLPSGVAEASSWDLDVAREFGVLIGRELRDQGFNMTLGGGVNLDREPRNGRNFEYQGEDPVLAGTMVGAMMKAEQEQGVIGDIKHYALNDQETGRSYVDVKISKRAMRESDLLAFEIAVKESGAGAVMCSYNLVNGDYACENRYLLDDVLKKDFGFKGFVVSDWGATHSTIKAALAGLDMEQPGDGYFGEALKKAVESGEVPMARLNDMVHRLLRTEFAVGLFDQPEPRQVPDIFKGFEVSRRIAEAGSVLLKNASHQLPLNASNVKSIAIIGSHADVGVLSGGGSAQVDPPGGNAVAPPPPPSGARRSFNRGPVWFPSSPLKAIQAKVPNAKVEFNAGTDAASAAELAKTSEVAIVFVNQPTSEGRDVPSLSLPDNQDALVEAVAAANRHTIVVLETGGAVTMPWLDKVSAVLEAWYPGIKGADAIANIIFGDVNPSGKLPMTFPASEAQLPHAEIAKQPPAGPNDMKPIFPGAPFKVNTRQFEVDYKEGAKVGYKWYEAQDQKPLFPFGFGLSYTSFEYSNLRVVAGDSPSVSFTVANTGTRAGAETAEVYASLPKFANESFKRLVAWQKVQLAPGESRQITLALNPHYLSIYNEDKNGWELLSGEYKVMVGPSSATTPLNANLHVAAGR